MSSVQTQHEKSGAAIRAESLLSQAVQVLGLTGSLEVMIENVSQPELKGALRRCLQEVREEQRRQAPGSVAAVEGEETPRVEGVVKVFKDESGYGFIGMPNGERDVFIHRSAIRGGPVNLTLGQRVRFSVIQGPKGLQAADVEIL